MAELTAVLLKLGGEEQEEEREQGSDEPGGADEMLLLLRQGRRGDGRQRENIQALLLKLDSEGQGHVSTGPSGTRAKYS